MSAHGFGGDWGIIAVLKVRHYRVAATFIILGGCSSSFESRFQQNGVVNSTGFANRMTWGMTTSLMQEVNAQGLDAYLDGQLREINAAALPADVQAQIDRMAIQRKPLEVLVREMDTQRKQADAITDLDARKKTQQEYQQAMNDLQREASTRFLLRALYSRQQLREQMTWFWFNHFNVHAGKHDLRAMIGDYESSAIRTHALGRFRDILGATAHHPAMLRYLDNEHNAGGRLNENYARELMELHTLGVGGGYTQQDVQELARILTGFGVNYSASEPKQKPEHQSFYVRRGVFEFNPARHDFGSKNFLGHKITGRGSAELDEALDILGRHPSTARFVSEKIATYFLADAPSKALIDRMVAVFTKTDGDIPAVLRIVFLDDAFMTSVGKQFKDPVHYAIGAVRYAYDGKVILNTGPLVGWINRMGQSLYGRQTPDGYPLTETAWTSPGQMTVRFEIARAIASGSAGLFKTDGPQGQDKPAFPLLSNALFYRDIQPRLRPETRAVLDQAMSPQEWGALFLSSPEMMYR